jgi:hypothetical protein
MSVDDQLYRSEGDGSELDGTMIMLRTLIDGSLGGLAIYHLFKADLVTIRGLPETPSRSIRGRR